MSLGKRDIKGGYVFVFGCRLDAFREEPTIDAACEGAEHLDQRSLGFVGIDITDDFSVQFDQCGFEIEDVLEPGITGTSVINRDGAPWLRSLLRSGSSAE